MGISISIKGNMKLIGYKTWVVVAYLGSIMTACGQQQKNELLLGNWTFYKFEFSGELKNIPPTESKKANDSNKGLVITFSIDDKFSSNQKDGLKNNSTGTYMLLPDDKLVIMGDTSKIVQLDKYYLKLYRDNLSPIAIFKKQ